MKKTIIFELLEHNSCYENRKHYAVYFEHGNRKYSRLYCLNQYLLNQRVNEYFDEGYNIIIYGEL